MTSTNPGTAAAAARDWRSRAACLSVADPDLFFPAAATGPAYTEQVTAAKAVCAGCPVVAECLAEALARIPDGIAGGLTADERRALRRRDRRAVATVQRAVLAAQRTTTVGAGGQAA
jgi:hypothetical protein